MVGNDNATRRERVKELQELIEERRRLLDSRSTDPDAADILVVLDGASRLLRSVAGVPTILKDGPQVGIYAICLDSEERLLPSECRALAVVERDGIRVQQTGAARIGADRSNAAC